MVKLTFLGDIMFDAMSRNLEKYRDPVSGQYDFSSVFSHIKPELDKSDCVLANLETPISLSENNLNNGKWSFCSPISFAEAVKACGVDFVSTANNHCLDCGMEGLASTVDSLDRIGLQHCGTQKAKGNEACILTVNGLRIGALAYTYGTNAFSNDCYVPRKKYWAVNLLQEQEGRIHRFWRRVFRGKWEGLYRRIENWLYPENKGKQVFEKETFRLFRKALIKKTIRKMKKEKVNLLISYLHVGGQYNTEPSSYTKRVTNWFLKKGCDIVIDNHEHVVHGSMISGRKIAAFALGNCLGAAGLEHGPYDRRAEYSIALHAYIDETTKRVHRVSFSIYKAILDENHRYEVWPVYDLLRQLRDEERERILSDSLTVAKVFSGRDYSSVEQEFVLKEQFA